MPAKQDPRNRYFKQIPIFEECHGPKCLNKADVAIFDAETGKPFYFCAKCAEGRDYWEHWQEYNKYMFKQSVQNGQQDIEQTTSLGRS